MSAKKCAKCEKTVYPTEELKCLEKVWHKACFKCQVCNMTLSMTNYKGFDKLPYCGAHVPKAKATIVADTPEMKRLAENSKNQSNVKYHAEFEASKGKFTQIADDPEIQRIKANSQTISNVTYHDVAGQKAEQEKKRSLVDGQPGAPGHGGPRSDANSNGNKSTDHLQQQPQQHRPIQPQQPQQQYNDKPAPKLSNASYTDSRKISGDYGGHHSGRVSQTSISSTGSSSSYSQQHTIQGRSQPLPPTTGIGYGQPQYGQPQMTGAGYPSQQQQGMPYGRQQQQQAQQSQYQYRQQQQPPPQQQQQMMRQLSGSGYYAQPPPQQQPQYHQQQQHAMAGYRQPQMYQQQQQPQHHQPPPQQQQQHVPQHQPQQNLRGRCYQAIYDYEAQDTDEVSFKDGDIVINCTPIDEGWMTGTVHRTGKFGMLPANYVEPINL